MNHYLGGNVGELLSALAGDICVLARLNGLELIVAELFASA